MRKHVVWDIKRENRSIGSTWAQDREKKDRTGQDRRVKKVTKALYFTYLGRSPHWTDFLKKLRSSCRPRRNHVCKLLSWNFQGLQFYRGSNFTFSYWLFHGPYNSAALLRCLWYPRYSAIPSHSAIIYKVYYREKGVCNCMCDVSYLLVEGHMVNMFCFHDALYMLVLKYVTSSQLCVLFRLV